MLAWDKALSSVGDVKALKIRERQRRGYSREADGHAQWTEYQVVEGRRVLWRAELPYQAERFIDAARTSARA